MIIALAFLSPLHHLRWSRQRRVEPTLADSPLMAPGSVAGVGVRTLPENGMSSGRPESKRQRIFLFVCRANTLRSPMAQQICSAEIASSLGVSIEQLEAAGIRVLSAGIAARPGEAMNPEGERVLAEIGVPVQRHASQLLTVSLIEQAEAIYCMTEEQRRAVINLVPAAAARTHRLDPDQDLAESHEPGAITVFAEQVRELIRRRFTTEMSFSWLPR
jgi:protein-tyrosine-phosphatase